MHQLRLICDISIAPIFEWPNAIVVKELECYKDQNSKYTLKQDHLLSDASSAVLQLKSSMCMSQLCALFSNAALSKDKVKVRKAVIESTKALGTDKDQQLLTFPKALQKKIQDALRLK